MKVENKFKRIRVSRDCSVGIFDAIDKELATLGEQGWQVTHVDIADSGFAADLVMSRPVGITAAIATTQRMVFAVGEVCLRIVRIGCGLGQTQVADQLEKELKKTLAGEGS